MLALLLRLCDIATLSVLIIHVLNLIRRKRGRERFIKIRRQFFDRLFEHKQNISTRLNEMFSVVTWRTPAAKLIVWKNQGTIQVVCEGPKLSPVVPGQLWVYLRAVWCLGERYNAIRVKFRQLFIFQRETTDHVSGAIKHRHNIRATILS